MTFLQIQSDDDSNKVKLLFFQHWSNGIPNFDTIRSVKDAQKKNDNVQITEQQIFLSQVDEERRAFIWIFV